MKLLIVFILLSISAVSYAATTQTPIAIKTIKGLDSDKNVYDKKPYQDIDQDGVIDKLDFCHNTGLNYEVDKNGCELDSDKDGIYNRADQCPNTPIGAEINFLGCERDEDQDSVLDSADRCPKTPIGTIVNNIGCEMDLDSDNDGVFDKKDQCPNSSKDLSVNKHGCVPKSLVITNIIFNTSSYRIRVDQKDILDKDVNQLEKIKQDSFIVITGYTDSSGNFAKNKTLSWQRAQSIKSYLVSKLNFDKNRILVLGKGQTLPIAPNNTEKGRQKNRRIALSIVGKNKIPKGAKLNFLE